MVVDALERMAVEAAWHTEQAAEQRRRQAYADSGAPTLGDGFPEMES